MDTFPAWMLEPWDSERRDAAPPEASPQVERKDISSDPEPGLGGKGTGSSPHTPPCPSCQQQALQHGRGGLFPAPLDLPGQAGGKPGGTAGHPPALSAFINPTNIWPGETGSPVKTREQDSAMQEARAGRAELGGFTVSPALRAHRMRVGPALLSIN